MAAVDSDKAPKQSERPMLTDTRKDRILRADTDDATDGEIWGNAKNAAAGSHYSYMLVAR